MSTSERLELARLALRCLDLTDLEPNAREDDIRRLCERARRPDGRGAAPSVAAVCVLPTYVSLARDVLDGSGVCVATVAGAFPSGVATVEERVREIGDAIDAGAQEIDTVLDRMALGDADGEPQVLEQLRASREAAGNATLKVILETGALDSPDLITQASRVAIQAGADFLKTSTGRVGLGASPGATRLMMKVVRDADARGDGPVGIKVAGGIRAVDDACRYLELARDVLGPDWLAPSRFRIGASSLLDGLIAVLGAA
jgi:deoxyribose-phosphate aldolase